MHCLKQKAAPSGFGYYRYNMRMAMTLDFSPPCKRDIEKESERRSTCWVNFVVNY